MEGSLTNQSVVDIVTSIQEAESLVNTMENMRDLIELGTSALDLARADIDAIRAHLVKCYIVSKLEGDMRQRYMDGIRYFESLAAAFPEPRRSARPPVPVK
eukprot:CAMPEP_0177602538 /NCGR_PEP_ID=MMETSP0419_2-20121207/14929_1 /TAXON_ID=582737 /ORGANISM="Tetraselmis sp., Strain GSL018" /LENGTH=100 /DNA_ID=CAMNT_0019096043 /DNA_START=180 /DNA_END=479 /DNA_ORIENTATION=+